MRRPILALACLSGLVVTACSGDETRIVRERIPRQAEVRREPLDFDRRGAVARFSPFEVPPVFSDCEPGEERSCGLPMPRGSTRKGPVATCVRGPDGGAYWARAACNTPLVLAEGDAPVTFTRPPGRFAIGLAERTEWVSAGTPWLALDRDGSGCVESSAELFAGFSELAALDANGDGVLDRDDPAFARLVLWSDRDQDRACSPREIEPLVARGVTALELAPEHGMPHAFASYEGDRALVRGGARARLVDVHLAPLP